MKKLFQDWVLVQYDDCLKPVFYSSARRCTLDGSSETRSYSGQYDVIRQGTVLQALITEPASCPIITQWDKAYCEGDTGIYSPHFLAVVAIMTWQTDSSTSEVPGLPFAVVLSF